MTRVVSLRDGLKKMSMSDPSDYSRINFTDGVDEIALGRRAQATQLGQRRETLQSKAGVEAWRELGLDTEGARFETQNYVI